MLRRYDSQAMNRIVSATLTQEPARRMMQGVKRAGRFVQFVALLFTAALTPATFRPGVRKAVAQAVCFAAGQALPAYVLFSVLCATVTTHLVAISAASDGLSHLALEGLVRVFVIELLPLAAALFVAMRSGFAALDHLASLRADGKRLTRPDGFAQIWLVFDRDRCRAAGDAACTSARERRIGVITSKGTILKQNSRE